MKGIPNGCLSCQKRFKTGEGVRHQGRPSPYKISLSIPLPPGTLAEPETGFCSMKQLGPTDKAANIWHYNNEL